MGKKARGRKGGVEAADNAHNQRLRASRAAESAVMANDRSAEPCPGFTDFAASVRSLVEDATGRSMERSLARLAQRGDVVLHLGPGEKNFAGADRLCTPCRRCSEAYNGGGIVCDACGVTWWCSAHCRALDGDGHTATCHHVKLLGFQIKRDDMRALPYVQESGELGCVFDLPREKKCDVASAATRGDVAAIDRLLAKKGAVAANATTAENPVPPIVCAALQGHAEAVTRLLRAGVDPNAASHLGCTAAFGAAQNGHVAVIEALVGSGADFDKPDAGAITPLGIAIENALPAVVDALLAAGADPDLRSGPNACPPLALAATQAAEKTISTTLPGSMIPTGAPVLDASIGIDTSGLDVSDSDEPRVRVAAASLGKNEVSFMLDMPLVDYVSKQAEITARLLAAPGLRDVDGVPAFVPLVDFATAGAMNRVAAAPALAATRALIAAGADPNAARRADRSRDDDKHTIVQGGAGDTGVRGQLQSKFGGFLAPSDVERQDRSDDMSASLTPLLALCHYHRRADAPRLDHYRALLDAGADPDRGVGSVRLSPLLGAVVRDDAAVASVLLAAGADASGTHDLAFFRCDRFIYFDPYGGRALAWDEARARRTLSTLEFAEIHRPNSEVTRLLRAAAGGGRDRGALAAMGVKALKAGLAALGLSTDGCFEKKDLVDRLAAAPAPAPASLAAADASADARFMAMKLSPHPGEAVRALRKLHRALARRVPDATAAARELVASCYLPGAPVIYEAVENIGDDPRAGTAARTLWLTALLSRCAFQLARHLNDHGPRAPEVAGDAIELLSNVAMDEPRSLYAALQEDSYQGLLQLVNLVISLRLRWLLGWEEQPELVGATTFRSRPWMSSVLRPADPMKTMYRRWSEVGADEIVKVLEALVREGAEVGAEVARYWLQFIVRSVILMAPLEDIHLLDAARSWDFAVEVCGRAQASPVLMAEEAVKTLSFFQLSFVRVLRTRAVEAYARICGETAAAKVGSNATLRRRAADMRAELQRLGRRTDFLDRAAVHAEAIRESTVEVLESGEAFEGAAFLLGDGMRVVRVAGTSAPRISSTFWTLTGAGA